LLEHYVNLIDNLFEPYPFTSPPIDGVARGIVLTI
jgi:hypothetical protein